MVLLSTIRANHHQLVLTNGVNSNNLRNAYRLQPPLQLTPFVDANENSRSTVRFSIKSVPMNAPVRLGRALCRSPGMSDSSSNGQSESAGSRLLCHCRVMTQPQKCRASKRPISARRIDSWHSRQSSAHIIMNDYSRP